MKSLDRIPRLSLSNLRTPIEKCERLSAVFPEGPQIFIKRDDFIGSLVWGNKLRKLEYSLADAVNKGADTIITCGGVQSNHARTTAQVSKRIGLKCHLVQNGEPQLVPTGNHKVNRLYEIPIHYVSSGDQRAEKMFELAEELKRKGSKPYIIPLGASNEIGCLGFVNAVEELRDQQEELGIEFDALIHSTSSGGTQAGLILGKKLYGWDDLKIIGISSDTSVTDLQRSILDCLEPAMKRLGLDFLISKANMNVDVSYVGEGYGLPTEASDEAERLFLDHEGILLDSTYTAKAAAGLINYIRKGIFTKDQKVLFWHTGGILAKL